MVIQVSETLVLEEVSDSDFDFLKNIYQDERIQTQALASENFKVEDSNIHKTISFFKESEEIMFIIKLRGKSIGFLMLYDLSYEKKETKMGIILSKDFQNLVIAMRVYEAAKEYVFNELDLNKIFGEVIESNKQMVSIIKRVGYQLVGVNKGAVSKGARVFDLQTYVLVKNAQNLE